MREMFGRQMQQGKAPAQVAAARGRRRLAFVYSAAVAILPRRAALRPSSDGQRFDQHAAWSKPGPGALSVASR